MNILHESWFRRLPALFEIPDPDPDRARFRIEVMERNVMLPVKVFFIGIILQSFSYSGLWIGQISSALDVTVETVQLIFGVYILISIFLALPLLAVRRLPLALLQWTVVTSSLVDALLIASMTLITGGIDSVLYWLFVGLIVRSAVSVPPGFSQIFLNVAISLCYALVAVVDLSIAANLDDATQRVLDLMPHEELGEPFMLRMLVLGLTTISCYGAQAFLERQRLADDEAG